ncbi:hypothetical protein PoB_004143400 [Plakobranchus ocellatus]|uniref:Uncharacterized protein n=1 Tax=Plakobranchus ocellatus TaxID=259542 RepID=A0AAV4B4C8_9GAST|nr:hypothetical protein PoB_004143400 [Plakobranchus ocellatus]
MTQRWSAAQCVPQVGLRGRQGALKLNLKTLLMTQEKTPSDPSPQPDVAKKPCTKAAHGQLMSVSPLRAGHCLKTLW